MARHPVPSNDRMVTATYSYELTPEQRAALEPGRRVGAVLFWIWIGYALFCAGMIALRLSTSTVRDSDHLWTYVVGLVTSLVQLGLQRSVRRSVSVAGSGELQLDATGMSGTLDGRAIRLGWPDIESARRTAKAIVIRRRHNAGTIAIPIGAIEDVTALWALLEDRLISKRNLVRSPYLRTFIVNSSNGHIA